MKILEIITLGDSIGGAQIHVLDLSIGLKNRHHDVHVLTGTKGILNEKLANAGVSNSAMPELKRAIHPIWDIKCFFALRQFIKDFQPDIVASHSSKAGLLVRLVCFSLGQPNTFTVHGWSFGESMPFLRRIFFVTLELLLRPFTDKMINVSVANQVLGLKYGILSLKKSTVIYNGVADTASKVKITEGSKFQLKTDNPTSTTFNMVMSARFQEPKNHALLLDALRPLKEKNWQLYLLGDGEDTLAAVKNLTKAYGLEDKINFIGYVNDVVPYLEKADLFLLISNWEGLPLSILEAMAHRLPIVATKVGGIPEQIKDGENGFLVERTDTEGLTQAIEKLRTNPALRQKMGQASRQYYEQKFQLNDMIEKTEYLHNSMIIN